MRQDGPGEGTHLSAKASIPISPDELQQMMAGQGRPAAALRPELLAGRHEVAPSRFPSPGGFPPVTGLLVVTDARRIRMARKAVDNFVAQLWPNKRLVIVNASPKYLGPTRELAAEEQEMLAAGKTAQELGIETVETQGYVVTGEHPWITETLAPPGQPTAALLNRAIDLADDGAWLCRWDDDTWSHPWRLLYQMAARTRHDWPVLLRNQCRFNTISGTAYVHRNDHGVPETALWPRANAAFPDVESGLSRAFLRGAFPRAAVLDNTFRMVPPESGDVLGRMFSVAFWHGMNAGTTLEEFMGPYASSEHDLKCLMDIAEGQYLGELVEPYGMTVTVSEKSRS